MSESRDRQGGAAARRPPSAGRLRLEEVRGAIPELEELRPLLDFLMSESEPDARNAWSGSGELATVESRLVHAGLLEAEAARLAAAEGAHLAAVYKTLGRALASLAGGDAAAAGEALLEVARLEEERERPSRALAYAETAHRLTRDLRDQRTAALALRRVGRASRALGRLEDALEAYARSHDMAAALSDARGAAEAAVGAGNTLEEQGRWAEATRWYRRALEAVRGLEPEPPERWHALFNLHVVTRSSGAISESLPLLEDAAQVALRLEGEAAVPFLENARGQLEMSGGRFAEAERHFRAALVQARGARARVTIGVNLAEALLAQGRLLDAAEAARSAERDAIRAGLASRLPEVYRTLGRIAAEERNPDAFVLFERALGIVHERGLPALEEALTLQAYARTEAELGDPEAAASLRERASRRFLELGIAHERWEWTDVYAPPAAPETHRTREGEDHAE